MFLQVKPHSEITIKSGSFRQLLVRSLRRNLRTRLHPLLPTVRLKGSWDRIDIWNAPGEPETGLAPDWSGLAAEVARTPGVQEINRVEETRFDSFADILEAVQAVWVPHLERRSFAVRVRRRGRHDFSSQDLERYLGAGLLQAVPSARVRLKQPDIQVELTVQDNRVRLITQSWAGVGGYPTGTQGSVLALFSGGFDSPVAAWQMMVRGLKTHFLYFSFGDAVQDAEVFAMARKLWSGYSGSHRVYFRIVPWVSVVNTLSAQTPERLRGVLLKRAMVRFAERAAQQYGIQALVMGDALGQVSSQSLHNMALTDQAASTLILRPLVGLDKTRIIQQAETIGTAELAAGMTEYCGTVGRFPSAAADADAVLAAEQALPDNLFDEPWRSARQIRIDRDFQAVSPVGTVPEVSLAQLLRARAGQWQVVDIRSPEEVAAAPLRLPGEHQVQTIPHYRFWSMAEQLDSSCQYLLYCRQAMMSRVQAARLRAEFGLQASVLQLDENPVETA